MHMPHTLC